MIESDNSLMNCVLPCIIKATLPDRETSGYILNVYLNAGKIDLAFDRRDASLFNKVSAKLILENVKLLEAGYQLVSEEVYQIDRWENSETNHCSPTYVLSA